MFMRGIRTTCVCVGGGGGRPENFLVMYFTDGRTDLPREAIGPPRLFFRGSKQLPRTIIGPPAKRHLSETSFKWRFAGGPMIAGFVALIFQVIRTSIAK